MSDFYRVPNYLLLLIYSKLQSSTLIVWCANMSSVVPNHVVEFCSQNILITEAIWDIPVEYNSTGKFIKMQQSASRVLNNH